MQVHVPGQAVDDHPVPVVHPALAAADQRDTGVEEPDGLGPLAGGGDVVLRGPLADLPVAVHLVAEAPVADPVRLFMPVGPPQASPVRVAGPVAVLDPGQRLVQGPGAHVQAQHRLHPRRRAPGHELVGPEPVGLLAAPGQLGAAGPLIRRADPVGPVVPGDEVPAWPADMPQAQVADRPEHVGAESPRVRQGRPLLEHAAVDAPAEVLDEAAEDPLVHRADRPVCPYFDTSHRFAPLWSIRLTQSARTKQDRC